MIGYFIKGVDQQGKPCQGIIMDKVRILVNIEMRQPGAIGGGQSMPFPLDAYYVVNDVDSTMHLVQPQFITDIGLPAADNIRFSQCVDGDKFKVFLGKSEVAIECTYSEAINKMIGQHGETFTEDDVSQIIRL